MARSTRNQPFCWQEKKILRLFRKLFTGNELSKFRNLYGTITEMDSDFNNQDIKFYTKTISTYSGLSEDWIPKGLKKLQDLKIIVIEEDRVNGKFKGKRLIFTPENIDESICDTITVKSTNGKSLNGFLESSEDISLLEDSIYQEEINNTSSFNKLHDMPLKYETINDFIDDFLTTVNLTITELEILKNYAKLFHKHYGHSHFKLKTNEIIDIHYKLEEFIEFSDSFNDNTRQEIIDLYISSFFRNNKTHSIFVFLNHSTVMYHLKRLDVLGSEIFEADGSIKTNYND